MPLFISHTYHKKYRSKYNDSRFEQFLVKQHFKMNLVIQHTKQRQNKKVLCTVSEFHMRTNLILF